MYPRIVGLVGKARSGKTTVAEYLRDKHGYVVLGFADPLKEMVLRALMANPPPANLRADDEDWADMIYNRRTPFTRWLLQWVGTDIIRNQVTPEWWLDDMAHRIEHLPPNSRVVIPDLRFPNEVGMVKGMGGEVWKLVRLNGGGIEAGAGHASETELLSIEPDVTITAMTGVPGLLSQVEELLATYGV